MHEEHSLVGTAQVPKTNKNGKNDVRNLKKEGKRRQRNDGVEHT